MALVEQQREAGAFKHLCTHFIQASALAAVESAQPDVAITDLELSSESGIEFAWLTRKGAPLFGVKYHLAVTGNFRYLSLRRS